MTMPMRTVLIAEDEEEVRGLLRRRLSGPNLRILMAANGAEALEAVRRGKPDLVILDYFMPQLDGFETCRALRSDARTRAIPVIMLSGLGPAAERFCEPESGPDAYVAKPIDWVDLSGRMQALLLPRPA
jgi:CheY-like chemotaxis protein